MIKGKARDTANGASKVNDSATLEYMKSTFNDHCRLLFSTWYHFHVPLNR